MKHVPIQTEMQPVDLANGVDRSQEKKPHTKIEKLERVILQQQAKIAQDATEIKYLKSEVWRLKRVERLSNENY